MTLQVGRLVRADKFDNEWEMTQTENNDIISEPLCFISNKANGSETDMQFFL